jgi:hypothetical protein
MLYGIGKEESDELTPYQLRRLLVFARCGHLFVSTSRPDTQTLHDEARHVIVMANNVHTLFEYLLLF